MLSRVATSPARRWMATKAARFKDADSLRALLSMHAEHAHAMRPLDVSACWSVAGRLLHRPEQRSWLLEQLEERPVLQPMVDTMLSVLPNSTCKAKPVVVTAHGMASVQRATRWDAGDEAWEALAAAAASKVRSFGEQDVASTAWTYATIERAPPASKGLLDAVASAAPSMLHTFGAIALSTTAHAYAKAGECERERGAMRHA